MTDLMGAHSLSVRTSVRPAISVALKADGTVLKRTYKRPIERSVGPSHTKRVIGRFGEAQELSAPLANSELMTPKDGVERLCGGCLKN